MFGGGVGGGGKGHDVGRWFAGGVAVVLIAVGEPVVDDFKLGFVFSIWELAESNLYVAVDSGLEICAIVSSLSV